MTVTFGDGTIVEIGTPRPSIVALTAPAAPAIALVPVPGPQGEQGIQGEQGEQGEQGLQGEQGDQGDTGPAGAGTAVSTDGSFSLPAPTGVGLEFVIVAGALDDIRWNGTSL